MEKSAYPRIVSYIPIEKQQEAILNCVLNIEAHTMTMANMMLNIQTHLVVSKADLAKGGFPAGEFYRQDFHKNVEILQKRYSPFGKIDTV